MRKPKFEFNENSLISDYLELARRLIPSVQDDNALLHLLWNETSYPSGTFLEIVRQLKAIQDKMAVRQTL